MVDRPLDISWMDSRIDLLDLLAQEGEYALESNSDVANAITIDDVEDKAVKVLQDMAEETSQLLAVGSTSEPELQSAVVAQAADNLQSVVHTADGPTSVDHLLDMLTTGMDPAIDVNSTVEDIPIQMDSDILTSVTAEDVESILSSEPSSPAVPNTLSFNELPPEQSNSLLAQYLMSDIGTTKTSPVYQSHLETSDLDSIISDVQSEDDDSDYVPSSYRVSKTPSTPYARRKAKSGSKSKSGTGTNKEARAMERKLRKKQQNKDAATRYRQKKREEAEQIDQECDKLEARNDELREKVDQMTREIGYLKNLLAEVYKARGLMAPKLGKWNHCIV